jgi:O-antigen ligase
VQLLQATLGVAQNGRFELKTPVNKLTGGRYGLMAGGIAMYEARPVAGWGLGSFPSVYPDYRPSDATPALRESHNSLITVAAELGTVGLVLLGWVLVTAGRQATRAVATTRRARDEGGDGTHALAVTAAAGLVALLVHSMLYAALVEDPFTWVFLALIPLADEGAD